MSAPNVLLIMTDEERYPPPYESAAVGEFRRSQLTARERIRQGGVELHRHYAGSTACVPSRATLHTGQYPSLHGVSQTSGIAKQSWDAGMRWLDPDGVPTLGDWFRAGGYQTHYRGKWHVSHADLMIPGTHEGLMASDGDGRAVPEIVEAYRKADRLGPFGYSGWIGREPHGAAKADSGTVRDGVFSEQVVDLFGDLARATADGPWLAVASFVNPHDIAFAGGLYELLLGADGFDATVPEIDEPPSQADSFAGRPACQELFTKVWPQMVAAAPTDGAYRRLYYYLHKLVDQAIGRILDALEASGLADDTIVVFTSDHGDLLGAHGGMVQKWCNAYDEAIRVPMLVKGPGIEPSASGIATPTSHVDLIPTLLGLAGIDVQRAAAGVAEHHTEVHDLPGRDLSAVLTGSASEASVAAPVYFLTEDDMTRGATQTNLLTGASFDAVPQPSNIEAVITALPTGPGGADELWKLNHYYERLDEWNADHGIAANPFAAPAAEPVVEVHNLTTDPEERTNHADDAAIVSRLTVVLDAQRDQKRLLPRLRNP
ncbi:sulfatase-like hydrolase/transferase [Aquihabitans sp. McL0605]|uniref:sulfatase-like hydrolase/transferase n=1 Tax=Aquihabitans sp. McL0605 TaxID=3415671 RepID=UPI003CF967AD